jgi:adenosine deaminase
MKLELSEQQVPNRKEIQAVLDFCPQRLGHVCCLNDEEWKKLKSSMIPVTFSVPWHSLSLAILSQPCLPYFLHGKLQVEICLTSNVMTGGTPSLELHHFGLFLSMQTPKVLTGK